MKQYVIIPVAYYQSSGDVYESAVYVGKRTADCRSKAGGNKLLQDYLNKGWKIYSVQTAPFSRDFGGAIFQYILESP